MTKRQFERAIKEARHYGDSYLNGWGFKPATDLRAVRKLVAEIEDIELIEAGTEFFLQVIW